jgi:hypothetical protein
MKSSLFFGRLLRVPDVHLVDLLAGDVDLNVIPPMRAFDHLRSWQIARLRIHYPLGQKFLSAGKTRLVSPAMHRSRFRENLPAPPPEAALS